MAFCFTNPIKDRTLLDPRTGGSREMSIGTQILSHREMRVEWFQNSHNLTWEESPVALPEDATRRIMALRGTDIPLLTDWSESSKSKTGSKNTRGGSGTTKPNVFFAGTMILANQTDHITMKVGNPRALKADRLDWCIKSHSQVPSIHILRRLRMSNGEKLRHRLILNGDQSMKSIKFHSPEALSQSSSITIPDEFIKAAKEKRLFGVTIDFAGTVAARRLMNSVTVLHDNYRTPNEVSAEISRNVNSLHLIQYHDRWSNNKQMIESLKFENLTDDMEQSIKALVLNDCTITLFRDVGPLDVELVPGYTTDFQCWTNLMQLSIDHGAFWWCKMQDKFDPQSPGAFFGAWSENGPPIAPWLIKTAKVTCTEQGITQVQPWTWSDFTHGAYHESEWCMSNISATMMLSEANMSRDNIIARQKQVEAQPAASLKHRSSVTPAAAPAMSMDSFLESMGRKNR
ncbi:MAG: hypothetical protein M1828_003826 [Chrysothrix sp. TS-e1954]|nr:MAG: hypothetical protein M1828_003826 [Chrysothrix sp. TS-e1954]